MKTKQLFMSAAIGTVALFGLNSCGDKKEAEAKSSYSEKVLVITAIPDKQSSDQSERYKALTDYLSKELDIKVKYHSSNSYSASVTSFEQGETQLAWFGGVTGVQARNSVKGAQAIAQGVVDPKYKSYFIAHKDTGLEKSDSFPKEIANMSFTFGSTSSTSGRVMPTHFIIENTGKKPKEFFTQPPLFAGKRSHTGVALDVNSGAVQTGVMSYKNYKKMVKKGDIDPEVVKIIWETPDYYDYNFTIHPDVEKTFGEGFISKVQDALVNCKDQAVLETLLREEGLIKAQNSDFNDCAAVMKKIGFE